MTRDMTEGNITRHLLIYAVPLMLGNLFQQLYHTVDSIVVARFNGKEALAAVGAAGPIMSILVFLFVGISMGTSILMAGYFGAKDYQSLKEELATSLVAGFYLTVALSVLSFAGSGLFIRLTRTPAEIADSAASYLRLISAGLFFTFLYNILSSALRAIGDSRAPLWVLIFTTFVNVLLDLFLVGQLKMGVFGAALATVLSQAVSAAALFVYIRRKSPLLKLSPRELKLNPAFLKKTVDYSSVSAVQQTMLYVGRLLVQSGVNSLGVDAVAAFNAVSIIDSYVLAPGDSLSSSMTTFVAQNLGGGRYDRIRQSLRKMQLITAVYTIGLTVFVFTEGRWILGLFLAPTETTALRLGLSYTSLLSLFYFLSGYNNIWQGYYRGIGRLMVTLYATVVQIPIRVVLSYALLRWFSIQSVAIGTAVGWIGMAIFEISMYRRTMPQKTKAAA